MKFYKYLWHCAGVSTDMGFYDSVDSALKDNAQWEGNASIVEYDASTMPPKVANVIQAKWFDESYSAGDIEEHFNDTDYVIVEKQYDYSSKRGSKLCVYLFKDNRDFKRSDSEQEKQR